MGHIYRSVEFPNKPGTIITMRINTGDTSLQASAAVQLRPSLFWDVTR